MKKVILITFVIFSLKSFSQTGTKNFIDQNFIEVTGKAETEIVPNEIYLKIRIDEKDFKRKKDLDEIEKSMIEKLAGIGIDVSKNLVIRDMISNFRSYWIKRSRVNSIKEYQLKVSEAKMVGKVFQVLEPLEISNISVEKVKHSDIRKFVSEVKIKAIRAAKEKAQSLTKAIDQNIGKAIYIQELGNPVYGTNYKRRQEMSNVVARGYSIKLKQNYELEFEKIKLEYSILVRFEITE